MPSATGTLRVRFTAGLLAVSAITLLAYRFQLNLATAAFLHLIVVVLLARHSGFAAAIIVSVVAVLSQIYFLVPPVLTFIVADWHNVVALVTFGYCALTVSRLSSEAARQAKVAERRSQDTDGLYGLSRFILLMNRRADPCPQIVQTIRRIFQCDGVVLFDAVTLATASCGDTGSDLANRTRDAFLRGRDEFYDARAIRFCMLRAGLKPIGAMALKGGNIDATVAGALASLVAVAIERVRSFENESRMEAARHTEQLRTAVLDALAHDFKTPLTVIRAASSGLLEACVLDEPHRELMTLIDGEAARLDDIAGRLLKMARLEAKDVRLNSSRLPVERVIAKVDMPRVRIDLADSELAIDADEQLLFMALSQLIDNALKYSRPGSEITVAASRQKDEAVISVHNHGEPIAESERARVFDRFYRGGNVAGRIAGTGLGLSIVRKIALAHSGRVWVSSDADGTTFFLALPAGRSIEEKAFEEKTIEEKAGSFMNCSNGTVLVVDDEPSIRRALRGALSAMGFLADEASGAEQSIDLVRRHHYDAILLDINMPDKCGIETCRELRNLSSALAILMVTARDAEEDMVQALAAGADDYIVKPFSMREITARLRAIRRGHASADVADAFQIRIGEISLDPERRSVTKTGASLHLTPKEFEVMEYLMRHAGAPVRHRALLSAVWGADYGNEVEYLRTMVRQLRLKIEDNPSSPRYLTTEPFIGYRFAAR